MHRASPSRIRVILLFAVALSPVACTGDGIDETDLAISGQKAVGSISVEPSSVSAGDAVTYAYDVGVAGGEGYIQISPSDWDGSLCTTDSPVVQAADGTWQLSGSGTLAAAAADPRHWCVDRVVFRVSLATHYASKGGQVRWVYAAPAYLEVFAN